MAKEKPKQAAAMPSSKAASRGDVVATTKQDFGADLCGEDGWVVVRKQRVIIWVPSLPIPETCGAQKPAPMQSQAELGKVTGTHETSPSNMVVERQWESRPEICPDVASADEPEKLNSLNPTSASSPTGKSSARSQQDLRIGSRNPDRAGTLKLHRIHRLSTRAPRPIMFPRVMCSSSLHEGNDNALLKQRLRAANLEKKLQKAGGMSKWLASIGLGEKFERIFKGKRLSKFQVANLTMEKLKQMGASAVGPRRKLIHAIRCVYHPYCLNAPWKCHT